MAEAILSHVGGGQFAAHSAGSHPAARVHAEAIKQMELAQMAGGMYRTKSWEMFAWPGAPRMDLVIALCDVAANRPRPQFPGNPISVHLPIPDPEAVSGSLEEVRNAFAAVFELLNDRIRKMVAMAGSARGKEDLGKEFERMVKTGRWLTARELMAEAGLALEAKAGLSRDLIPA